MIKNFKNTRKTSNGITLIALVITIIVLLILAGISISMLSGDNGILQKSAEAKRTTERAEAKEQAQLDIMAWITDRTANNQDVSLDNEKIKEILSDNKPYVKEAKDTSFTTAKGEYEIPYSELYNNDGTHVPPDVLDATGDLRITDFSIAGTPVTDVPLPSSDFVKVADTEIDNSYVAKGKTGTDYEGDEFVWVPVDKDQEFTVKIEGSGNIASVVLTNPVGDTKTIASNITAPQNLTGITPTVENKVYNGEYKVTVTPQVGDAIEVTLDVYSLYAFNVNLELGIMKASFGDNYETFIQFLGGLKAIVNEYSEPSSNYSDRVAANGGFWIGRYEASQDNGRARSKKNVSAWNSISRTNALTTANAYNTTLKSSLPTGAAWDRTLGWIYEKRNSTGKNLDKLTVTSSTWGNYAKNGSNLINTGSTDETMANNIYDLAGNLWEWSTDNTLNETSTSPVVRGGAYNETGSSFPAAARSFSDDVAQDDTGFRLVLYK